jgi:peroxiredoxin Q/BCP
MLLAAAAALLGAAPAGFAQAPSSAAAAAPAPEVNAMAPDFQAPSVDSAAGAARSVSLKSLRGQVVVLAFYPKDRTSGCTAEMSKFRDDYATLFGTGVVVLPVSLDSISSHASWAQEMKFPFALVSDVGGSVATLYGALPPGRPYANRSVFVIGKDGRVAYRELKFGALNQQAYDALAAAVAQAKKG